MAHRRGELRADRKARLDALGFDWQKKTRGDFADLWEQRYAEMAVFKELHGHTRVPKGPPGNKVLWHWRHAQREFRRKGMLKAERIARLDAIGFEWEEPAGGPPSIADYLGRLWNAKFELLRQFKECFGHTCVPKRWKEDPALGQWVGNQRRANRRNQLKPERKAQLESLGFEWRATATSGGTTSHREKGDRRVAQLAAFKERFGHTRVPRRWKEDSGLGEWVRAQRRAGRRNQLKPERKAQLESLGFEWPATAASGGTR
jgi:hypothetical protein